MAILIPDNAINAPDIKQGEKKVLRTFRDNLDNSCYLWFEPKLEKSRRPDVVLYYPELGLLVLEIKDWSIENIIKANPDTWIIKTNGKEESKTSPFKQAKGYSFNIMNILKNDKRLIHSDGEKKGRLIFPIATGCIFPNIKKSEYTARGLEKIIETKYCFFSDEIEVVKNTNNYKDINKLFKGVFDPWWENDELTKDQLDSLRATLYPEIVSEQKEKGGERVKVILDEYQEQIAKSINHGHNRVMGVAGSGKSLVLACKAKLLLQNQPKWNILFTCYNISLASQLKYYFNSFQTDYPDLKLNYDNLKVVHFHGLCSEIFKGFEIKWPMINKKQALESARFENMSDAEKEAELDELQSSLLGNELQKLFLTKEMKLYDAILIDEAQDFHPSWLRAITLMLNGKTNFLLLAEDPNQKIYPRTFTYKDANIQVVGKPLYRLPLGYRSTKEIILPASKLVQKAKFDKFYEEYVEEQENKIPEVLVQKNGTFPEIKIISRYADICDDILSNIEDDIKKGFALCDIGIIYLLSKSEDNTQKDLFNSQNVVSYVENIAALLSRKNINYYWLTQSKESKENYDQFRDCVTISTIFSAKGLEFSVVYLVGLELFPWRLRNERENASLLYVAMTRAKEKLTMYSLFENSIIKEINGIIEEFKGDKK